MPVEIKGDEVLVSAPLAEDDVAKLRVGMHVKINGVIYTARDAAHRRLVQALDEGKPLPVDLKHQIVYYVGPTPARPGRVIGSAGPTTSMRLDPYTVRLLEAGVLASIGKGGRGPAVKEALQKYHGVYFIAIGGAGALLSKTIKSAEVVAYEDLGTESIKRLEVENFPAIVCCDMYGGDLLLEGKEKYRNRAVLGDYVSVPPAAAAG